MKSLNSDNHYTFKRKKSILDWILISKDFSHKMRFIETNLSDHLLLTAEIEILADNNNKNKVIITPNVKNSLMLC